MWRYHVVRDSLVQKELFLSICNENHPIFQIIISRSAFLDQGWCVVINCSRAWRHNGVRCCHCVYRSLWLTGRAALCVGHWQRQCVLAGGCHKLGHSTSLSQHRSLVYVTWSEGMCEDVCGPELQCTWQGVNQTTHRAGLAGTSNQK